MSDQNPDEQCLRFVAAQIGAVVCDAERDAAEAIAATMCSEPEFFDRRDDREGGCRRLAETAYEAAFDEIQAILDDHRLAEYSDEIEEAALSVLAHGFIGVWEEFEEIEDARAVADAIRRDGFGTAEALEEWLQMTFDVWTPDPDSIERQRAAMAQGIQSSFEDSTKPRAPRPSKQLPQDNSIPAKIGAGRWRCATRNRRYLPLTEYPTIQAARRTGELTGLEIGDIAGAVWATSCGRSQISCAASISHTSTAMSSCP